ncbi:MAG: hypothetical protein KGS72_27010 [Cyanobacteria bacterium REEB67]|nr:hypothetical protein [Cyanobacteria bacterium REEB67]
MSNQGEMGKISASGSLSDLQAAGFNIIHETQDPVGATVDIYCGYDGDIKLIFSGVVDEVKLDFDEDSFEIHGRDHSAVFQDGEQTMASFNYKNQTVAQIVKQFADKFGYKADITDPGIKAGMEINGMTVFDPKPQSLWRLLQRMAQHVGYECYTTPDQTLYFGPEKSQGEFTVNYGASPNSGLENPGWGLTVDYAPRNNSNIKVNVISQHSQTTKKILATASTQNLHVGRGRKTSTGISGSNSKPSFNSFAGSGSKLSKKTTFNIFRSGINQDQADKLAKGMADQLAKRQVILEMSIEGLPELKVHSIVKLKQEAIDLYGFANIPLNVAEVTHSYSAPQEAASSSGGYVTNIKAIAQIDDVA